jgi:alpha-mannosidase
VPEDYFRELAKVSDTLPIRREDMNPFAVGCYTSQIRIKQKHRLLENELYATEKMCSAAWIKKGMAYPGNELKDALHDLAMSEFHDILPGSSIQPVEEMALRVMDHGLEIISRVKARAFFALAFGEQKALDGETPILVYNPHPYPVRAIVECEFQLADFNWTDSFTQVTVYKGAELLPSQVEKELSNLTLDWRKRVVFFTELMPMQMNRFNCNLTRIPGKPVPEIKSTDNFLHFNNGTMETGISMITGLMEYYRVNGHDYLRPQSFCATVIEDNEDAWGMNIRSFKSVIGQFELMTIEESTLFSGIKNVTTQVPKSS